MRIETDLDGAVVGAIERHYFNAKEKHPYFCDQLLSNVVNGRSLDALLADISTDIVRNAKTGSVAATYVLDCELCEMESAIAWGDTSAAVEECYDAIAVLLRVVDVLEGRQTLGRPKEGEVAK